MDVAVLQSSAGSKVQWFYNKLLGVFSDRVRGVVEGELQLQLESKAQELKLQLRTLVAGVSACSFRVLVRWQPVPLYALFIGQAYTHACMSFRLGQGDW